MYFSPFDHLAQPQLPESPSGQSRWMADLVRKMGFKPYKAVP
jgi:hypothetical protein